MSLMVVFITLAGLRCRGYCQLVVRCCWCGR